MKKIQAYSIILGVILVLSSCTVARIVFWNMPGSKDSKRFDREYAHRGDSLWNFFASPSAQTLGQKLLVKGLSRSPSLVSLDAFLEHSPSMGFMIIRNDTILYENYFDKATDKTDFTSFSIAKTLVGLLVGVALDENKIQSINDPVVKYLPEYKDLISEKVLLKHLLDQNSGLKLPSAGNLYYTQNITKLFTKNISKREEPGSLYYYDNGNSQLLGMIVQRVANKTITQYLEEKIWKHIGAQSDLFWSLDKPFEQEGMAKAFCCLNAKMTDYAKIARLLLHKGAWNGKQLVPEAWIEESINGNRKQRTNYKYHNQLWSENLEASAYYAVGLYGQYLYIYPKKKLIFINFAKPNNNQHKYWSELFMILSDQL
jgi:CubicO group peptidase (beta-lactamase class C family)